MRFTLQDHIDVARDDRSDLYGCGREDVAVLGLTGIITWDEATLAPHNCWIGRGSNLLHFDMAFRRLMREDAPRASSK